MADCSVLGPNYSEDPVTGACIYTPSEVGSEDFPGTVESLGFSEDFIGTTFEDDPETPELEYAHFFDPYIKQKEDILKRHALGDVSQLGEGWELLQKQLSETLGLEYEETGLKSRAAYGKLGADKTTARDKTGMVYHGGLEKRIGAAESNIMEGYRSGRKASKSVYEQSIDNEARKHRDAVTDIYEKLELGIYDLRFDWKEGERATLDDVLLSGIFPAHTPLGGWEEGDCVTNCADGCQSVAPCQPGQSPGGVYFTSNDCCEGSGTDDDTGIDWENCPDCSCTTNVKGEQSCIDQCTGMEIAGSNC